MASARTIAGISIVGCLCLTALATQSCGSDSESDLGKKDASSDVGQGGSSGGGGVGGIALGGNAGAGALGGGGSGGGTSCGQVGANCVSGSDCCSASCNPSSHVCEDPVGNCQPAGSTCAAATECCTLVCMGGTCGATQCKSDLAACTQSSECCSGTCASSICEPLSSSCKTAGNSCSSNNQCCSHLCSNGNCSNQPSFCTQTGDTCAKDAECCGGLCSKQTGATLGTCSKPKAPGTTGCQIAGEVCGDGANGDGGLDVGIPACGGECCSRSCAPYGPTGVLVCQPPSGCHPTGEICTKDSDCCGAPGVPGGNGSVECSKANPTDPVGRCDNGNACRPAGAVCKLASTSCNAENNCCAGNVNQDPSVCQQDLLGIPRCTGVGDCADAGSLAGKACATSADCCGLPCVPAGNVADGGSPFVCGTSCVPSNGKCTTDADCCAGLPCKAPPGSTEGICGTTNIPDGGTGGSGGSGGSGGTGGSGGSGGTDAGTCAYYGQNCTVSGDCCNNVPCTNGHCVFPPPP